MPKKVLRNLIYGTIAPYENKKGRNAP